MTESSVIAGWHPDPTGRHEQRYWNGSAWTEHVVDAGLQSTDALEPQTAPVAQDAGDEPASDAQKGYSPSTEEAEHLVAEPAIPMVQEVPLDPVPQIAEREDPPAPPAPGAATPAPPITQPESVPIFGARKFAEKLQAENVKLQSIIDTYGLLDVVQLEDAKSRLRSDLVAAGRDLENERAQIAAVQQQRALAEAEVVDLRAVASLQEFGVYDFEHPAEDSVKLSGDLLALRAQIAKAVKDGQATTATENFTFNNSVAKGAKFVRDMSKLMLRSYNAEAENCIKSVRAGNLDSARVRLTRSMDQVERLGSMINLQITPYYHRLRLAEMELAARHMQALQVEKEAERARREELREQKRAEQELQAERARLEKERSHYENALAALEAKGDLEGAARMREQIADTERAISDVDYRVANARAGYVYVISNVGSFGPDVVKIGMTRRLEPMDRVNELGDASVPFRFDVHALFFSADAVALETALHQHFAERRLNRVNLRREYFRATPADVLEALKQHQVEVLEYALEPLADEYRASLVAAEPGTVSSPTP